MGKMKLNNNKKGNSIKSKNLALTIIVVVVLVAVLLSTVATLLTSSGLITRTFSALKSDNYKVSGNMMKYFYANTYSNFAETYSPQLKMFSIGENSSFEDHKKIVIGGTEAEPNSYDQTYFSSYAGKTWFDMFMDQTVTSVKSMLVYCEEANALKLKLTDEEKSSINSAIDTSVLQFQLNMAMSGSSSVSEATCFAAMYGVGVNRSDIRKAMELSTLASKCSEKIQETLEAAITDSRIDKEYSDNKLDYDAIDYFYYRYSVDYDEIVESIAGKNATDAKIKEKKDEIMAKYQKEIDEAKALAEGLAACTTIEEFKAYVINNAVNDKYAELFTAESIAAADTPDKESLKIIDQKLTEAVVKEVLEGADETVLDDVKENEAADKTKTYTAYGFTVTEKFAKSIKDIREDLFTALNSILDTYDVKKGSYNKNDDFMKWAFDSARKDGEIKTITEGDGVAEGELKADKEYYRSTVYFLIKKQYKDEQPARNVAYALFANATEAGKLIDKLKEFTKDGAALTTEKFEELAKAQSAAGNAKLENYVEGNMGSAAFDAWLFGEELKKGEFTETGITMSDDSVMVAVYTGEGDQPCWKVNVKSDILNDDYTAKEDKMTKTYSGDIKKINWVIGLLG